MKMHYALRLARAQLFNPVAKPSVRNLAMRSYTSQSGTQHLHESLLSVVNDHELLRTSPFIGGSWDHTCDEVYPVTNPANGQVIARIASASGRHTDEAIAYADSALPGWKNITAKARSGYLKAWHKLILENREDLASIMTMECGKPLAESNNEITAGAASVEWFAEEAVRLRGQVLQPVADGRQMVTIKQAVGVVGAITPWNFPMSMITRKVAPALAAGCSVVLKPSEQTPLTAYALAVLAKRAGLPNGVLNVLTGDATAIGDSLLGSRYVRKIGFTGSTRVGKMLLQKASATVKRTSMELGGNAPLLVFDDADVQLAVDAVVASGLRNAGQTCICANRVMAGIYDEFSQRLAETMRGIRVGSGMDRTTKMGPLINAAQVNMAREHVDDAVKHGAEVLCGGSAPDQEDLSEGTFFLPTLLGNATIDMRIFKEETFAPVVPLFKFNSEEEAIQLANDTEYGLAAYFFTKDLARAWRVSEALEYGMIGLNETAIVSETAPFGGMKQSGLGRENGPHGLDEFVEEKYICMGLKYT